MRQKRSGQDLGQGLGQDLGRTWTESRHKKLINNNLIWSTSSIAESSDSSRICSGRLEEEGDPGDHCSVRGPYGEHLGDTGSL